MRSVPVVAVALRELRRGAGLSQEQLAERAGVTERTVRALESGATARPRRDTLDALGLALGLGSQARRDFVASWDGRDVVLGDMFTGWTPDRMLQERYADLRRRVRVVSTADTVVIDADGHVEEWSGRICVEAVHAGVDRYMSLHWVDPSSFRPELLSITATNGRIEEVVLLQQPGSIGFEVHLLRELTVGQRYAFEFAIDYRRAGLPQHLRGEPDTRATAGIAAPVSQVEVEVRFHPDRVPVRVMQTRQATVDGPEVIQGELALSPFGMAQLHLSSVPAGAYGVAWEWPREDPVITGS